jgi:hypothetical protein
MERDNVTPSCLAAVRVAVLNAMSLEVDDALASEPWIRSAARDSRVEPDVFRRVIETRFGKQVVSFDPSDIGSNREASSQNYTVVAGGSLSTGEWEKTSGVPARYCLRGRCFLPPTGRRRRPRTTAATSGQNR